MFNESSLLPLDAGLLGEFEYLITRRTVPPDATDEVEVRPTDSNFQLGGHYMVVYSQLAGEVLLQIATPEQILLGTSGFAVIAAVVSALAGGVVAASQASNGGVQVRVIPLLLIVDCRRRRQWRRWW